MSTSTKQVHLALTIAASRVFLEASYIDANNHSGVLYRSVYTLLATFLEVDVFSLDEVVPWGRSFDEYRLMFALSDADIESRILGCADGPAGFNAEATRRGGNVVSCDPLYAHDVAWIRRRIDETYDTVMAQARENLGEFVWTMFGSVDELGAVRMRAMGEFLDDFELGRSQGRYVEAQLPVLPFRDHSFDLALCSHFLFLYSEQLGQSFHIESIRELCRVAREVRIFPLTALGAVESPHVGPVSRLLEDCGFAVSIKAVPYEFQRGGDRMMRVSAVSA